MNDTQIERVGRTEAESLILVSQDLVEKVDFDVAACKVGIAEAAEAFDLAKRTFKNVSFKNAENLLEKTGFEYTTYEEAEAFELSIDVGEEQDFSVKKLSSGRFSGLILALLAALATVAALVYLAMSKLNIDFASLNLETATSHVNPILTWLGADMVPANNMMVGALILGFSALIMAWIVYAVRTSMKGTKNLNIAKDTFEKSNEYCMTQEECQIEMKKVNLHLREATTEIGNFEMILNEQASVLKRILHVEGAYDNDEQVYHPSSKKVMRETEKIMKTSENLLETAVTKEKKLNFKSVQALSSAREVYAEYLGRIYD